MEDSSRRSSYAPNGGASSLPSPSSASSFPQYPMTPTYPISPFPSTALTFSQLAPSQIPQHPSANREVLFFRQLLLKIALQIHPSSYEISRFVDGTVEEVNEFAERQIIHPIRMLVQQNTELQATVAKGGDNKELNKQLIRLKNESRIVHAEAQKMRRELSQDLLKIRADITHFQHFILERMQEADSLSTQMESYQSDVERLRAEASGSASTLSMMRRHVEELTIELTRLKSNPGSDAASASMVVGSLLGGPVDWASVMRKLEAEASSSTQRAQELQMETNTLKNQLSQLAMELKLKMDQCNRFEDALGRRKQELSSLISAGGVDASESIETAVRKLEAKTRDMEDTIKALRERLSRKETQCLQLERDAETMRLDFQTQVDGRTRQVLGGLSRDDLLSRKRAAELEAQVKELRHGLRLREDLLLASDQALSHLIQIGSSLVSSFSSSSSSSSPALSSDSVPFSSPLLSPSSSSSISGIFATRKSSNNDATLAFAERFGSIQQQQQQQQAHASLSSSSSSAASHQQPYQSPFFSTPRSSSIQPSHSLSPPPLPSSPQHQQHQQHHGEAVSSSSSVEPKLRSLSISHADLQKALAAQDTTNCRSILETRIRDLQSLFDHFVVVGMDHLNRLNDKHANDFLVLNQERETQLQDVKQKWREEMMQLKHDADGLIMRLEEEKRELELHAQERESNLTKSSKSRESELLQKISEKDREMSLLRSSIETDFLKRMTERETDVRTELAARERDLLRKLEDKEREIQRLNEEHREHVKQLEAEFGRKMDERDARLREIISKKDEDLRKLAADKDSHWISLTQKREMEMKHCEEEVKRISSKYLELQEQNAKAIKDAERQFEFKMNVKEQEVAEMRQKMRETVEAKERVLAEAIIRSDKEMMVRETQLLEQVREKERDLLEKHVKLQQYLSQKEVEMQEEVADKEREMTALIASHREEMQRTHEEHIASIRYLEEEMEARRGAGGAGGGTQHAQQQKHAAEKQILAQRLEEMELELEKRGELLLELRIKMEQMQVDRLETMAGKEQQMADILVQQDAEWRVAYTHLEREMNEAKEEHAKQVMDLEAAYKKLKSETEEAKQKEQQVVYDAHNVDLQTRTQYLKDFHAVEVMELSSKHRSEVEELRLQHSEQLAVSESHLRRSFEARESSLLQDLKDERASFRYVLDHALEANLSKLRTTLLTRLNSEIQRTARLAHRVKSVLLPLLSVEQSASRVKGSAERDTQKRIAELEQFVQSLLHDIEQQSSEMQRQAIALEQFRSERDDSIRRLKELEIHQQQPQQQLPSSFVSATPQRFGSSSSFAANASASAFSPVAPIIIPNNNNNDNSSYLDHSSSSISMDQANASSLTMLTLLKRQNSSSSFSSNTPISPPGLVKPRRLPEPLPVSAFSEQQPFPDDGSAHQ